MWRVFPPGIVAAMVMVGKLLVEEEGMSVLAVAGIMVGVAVLLTVLAAWVRE